MLQKFSCIALLRKKEKESGQPGALRQKLLVREEERSLQPLLLVFSLMAGFSPSLGFGMGQFSWNMLLLNSKRLDVFMQINS